MEINGICERPNYFRGDCAPHPRLRTRCKVHHDSTYRNARVLTWCKKKDSEHLVDAEYNTPNLALVVIFPAIKQRTSLLIFVLYTSNKPHKGIMYDTDSLVYAQDRFAEYATHFLLMYHIIGMVSLTCASLSIVFRREVLSHTTGIPHDAVLFLGMTFGTIGTLLQTFLYKVKMHTTAKSCERIASLLSIFLSGLETSELELSFIRKTILTEIREVDLLWYKVPTLHLKEKSGKDCDHNSPRILSVVQPKKHPIHIDLP